MLPKRSSSLSLSSFEAIYMLKKRENVTDTASPINAIIEAYSVISVLTQEKMVVL